MTSKMEPPSKTEVMLALLETSEARVHLDARRPSVELPRTLLTDGHVCLDYGYSLRPAITDLTIDESGIRATLSFQNTPTPTFVPWSAVYLIANFEGRGAVWQNDIPDDLILGPMAEGGPERPGGPPLPLSAPAKSPAQGKDAKPRPSHLKLVK